MEKMTKEEAAKRLGYGKDSKPAKYNIPDLLQQTINQTVLVTAHDITDYMISYIIHKHDYEENKKVLDEIIAALKGIEKRYEDRVKDGENNSKVNGNNNQ